MANILKYIVLILFLSASSVFGYGDYQTLEIIAPKASESGSPAIPSTHRCFYAYPGLTYTFKAQVIGGDYPYTFSLSGAPSGMTIGEHTGVITWTNPQSNSGTITLTVYDRDGDSTSSTWSITVGTTGWYFVDDNAEPGGDGTIASPYNSIDDIMALNDEDGRVYFRSGTYTIPTYHPDYSSWNYTANFIYNNSPHIWIAYPTETPIISPESNQILQCNEQTTPYYFSGFKFLNMVEHVWVIASGCDYFTIYNCEVDGLTTSRTSNSNQGVLFATDGSDGYYLALQNSSIHDYTGVAGFGSLYNTIKCLVENNTFYNQSTGGSGICTAIAAKAYTPYLTIRSNSFDVSNGSCLGDPGNGIFTWHQINNELLSENIEICYNLFRSTGNYVHQFNNNSNQGTTWYYRNTCVGTWQITWLDNSYSGRPDHNGPFYLDGNVIVNNNSDTNPGGEYIDSGTNQNCNHITYHYNCGSDPIGCCMVIGATQTDLRGTISDSIVDASGNLQGDYTSYLGTTGWQIDASEYYGSPSSTRSLNGVSLHRVNMH